MKTIAIKYNGKMGDPGDSPIGLWPKGEVREVPEDLALRLLKTKLYELKGTKLVTPDKSPDIDPIEQAVGAMVEPQPEPKAKKRR